MQFNGSYILDSQYFAACYQASFAETPRKRRWPLGLVLFCAGAVASYFTDWAPLASYLLIGFGVVEIIADIFHRSWYLARQRISRAFGKTVTFAIDGEGVHSHSVVATSKLSWTDLTRLSDLEYGFLLHLKSGGKVFLARSALNDDVTAWLANKATKINNSGQ